MARDLTEVRQAVLNMVPDEDLRKRVESATAASVKDIGFTAPELMGAKHWRPFCIALENALSELSPEDEVMRDIMAVVNEEKDYKQYL